MKTRTHSITVALIVVVLLGLIAGPAAAGDKTYFELIEYPAGPPLFPNEPHTPNDGRFHVRGMVMEFKSVATDPRLSDTQDLITINWNAVFMPEPVGFSGPMWGTSIITNAGGYWEGSWTGVRDENGFEYLHWIGTGYGGYEGLKYRMWGERLTPNPAAPVYWTGYIIENNG